MVLATALAAAWRLRDGPPHREASHGSHDDDPAATASGSRSKQWQLPAESLALVVLTLYAVYRTFAATAPSGEPTPGWAPAHGAERRRASRQDGFLVSVMAMPVLFSVLLDTEGGESSFWCSMACSMHATVVCKTRDGRGWRATLISIATWTLATGYLSPGDDTAHILLSVVAFDALFRLALQRLAGARGALSRGESLLLACGLSVSASDSVAGLLKAVYGRVATGVSSVTSAAATDAATTAAAAAGGASDRPAVADVVQVLVVGACAVGAGVWPAMEKYGQPTDEASSGSGSSGSGGGGGRKPAIPPAEAQRFYVTVLAIIALGMVPWMTFLLGQDPFSWLAGFLLARPGRLVFLPYWVALIVGVVWVSPSSASPVPAIVVRKLFHLLAVAMFMPAVLLEYDMMYLSFGVAVTILAVLEFARIVRLPPVGHRLHAYMARYADDREVGVAIRTHIYLLLGCALPVWFAGPASGDTSGDAYSVGGAAARNSDAGAPGWSPLLQAWPWSHNGTPDGTGAATWPQANPRGLLPFAGVLITGVGDAAAAVVGSMYGTQRWSGTGKTYLGTFAAVVSVVAATALFDAAYAAACVSADCVGPVVPRDAATLAAVMAAIVAVCLLETFTAQVDNIVLPIYFYAMLSLALA